MENKHIKEITLAGLLSALGLLIPNVMPLKIILPISTYTLASHVPIFIAMFINMRVAIMVTLITAFGFFISMPLIVAARALSHIFFVIVGARYLENHHLKNRTSIFLFNLGIGIIHAAGEFLIVTLVTIQTLSPSVLWQYFIFLGLGTLIHSMVDFYIALPVVTRLNLNK